tara:strand:+ start:1164 stop:1601 length:438 start_codon:yes stop_codon:yes gene_type:complete
MSKYNVVLHSTKRVVGSSIVNAGYNFNFGNMPEGDYKMSFSLYSSVGTIALLDSTLIVAIRDLGIVSPSFSGGSDTNTPSNGYLGVVASWYAGNTGNYLYANYLSNSPIQLLTKPSSNNFSVQLLRIDGTPATITNDYVLTLYFE